MSQRLVIMKPAVGDDNLPGYIIYAFEPPQELLSGVYPSKAHILAIAKRSGWRLVCAHCGTDFLSCRRHCSESPDGYHAPNPASALLTNTDWRFSVACKHCKLFGVVDVKPEPVDWG